MSIDHWSAFRSFPEIYELAEYWATTPRPDWTDCDDRLYRWLRNEPDKGLATICAIAQITEDPETLSSLAAGPLEDFLCIHGEQVLLPICNLAREHDLFRDLLGGVWQLSMSKVFYQKIRAIAAGRIKSL